MKKNVVMLHLIGVKSLLDDMLDWAEENKVHFIPGYSMTSDGLLCIELLSKVPGEPLIMEEVNEIMKTYDFDGWVEADIDSVKLGIRTTPLHFTMITVSLIDYATERGFVLDDREMGELQAGKPEIFEFLNHNRDFALRVIDGVVVID